MSRKNRHEQHHPAAVPVVPLPPATEASDHDVPKFVKCPLCGDGYGGRGLVHNGPKGKYVEISDVQFRKSGKRNYRCNMCGHTWVALVTVEVVSVEHRDVDLSERTP